MVNHWTDILRTALCHNHNRELIEMICLSLFVPLYVASLGVNAEEELPLLVGPVGGGYDDITARL